MEWLQTIHSLIQNLQPANVAPMQGAHDVPPLVGCGEGDIKAGHCLCKYKNDDQLQEAFNAAVSAMPAGMDAEVRDWALGKRIRWVLLPPAVERVMFERGYVGAVWK